MKPLILYLTILLLLISCVEPSTSTTHKISNPLNHNVVIKTYSNGQLSDSLVILKNTFYEKNINEEAPVEPYFYIYDSIIYIFDNSKSTIYIKNTVDINTRNIAINANWKIESTLINKRKKKSMKIYEYTFIEQDYLDAR